VAKIIYALENNFRYIVLALTLTVALIWSFISYGVPFIAEQVAHASGEVILCAGAYQTPALLERSGIGRPDVVNALGVPLQHALPGVGEGMIDHMYACVSFSSRVATINDIFHNPIAKIRAGLEYFIWRKGWLATASMSAQALTRSTPESTRADLKIQINGISMDLQKMQGTGLPPVHKQSGFSLRFFPIYPNSRGRVHSASIDPLVSPNIETGYLSDPGDIAVTLSGLKLARSIASKGPLAKIIVEETVPGAACTNDSELIDYIRSTGQTVYHPVGTCRMGTDGMAVVDSQLRVHGLQGLRIADASIMPTLAATHTNAPSIMVGERAAAWVLESARK
jgi:choline dehydrogenase